MSDTEALALQSDVAQKAIVVTYTDAQIKARCWAVDAVPAPGAGKILVFDKLVLDINIVQVYTNINATDARLTVVYDSPDDEIETGAVILDNRDSAGVFSALFGNTPGRNFLTLSHPFTLSSGGGTPRPVPYIWNGTADLINKNLGLLISNPTNGNLTGGDVGNYMAARFYYDVMDAPA